VAIVGNRPERQRVHGANRPRAHGKDVAHDAADARGRALERLDRARMVVRLDLERDGQSIADVNDAAFSSPAPTRISATWLETFSAADAWFFVEQCSLHISPRRCPVRCSSARARGLLHVGVFLLREVVFGNQFRCDGRFRSSEINF